MGKTAHLYGTMPETEYDAEKVGPYNGLAALWDGALGGETAVTTTGGTTTLSTAQATKPRLKISGTLTSNAIIELPISATTGRLRQWTVHNNTTGDYSLTVRLVGGSGVKVPQGLVSIISHDGTNVVAPQSVANPFTSASLLNSWANYNPGGGNLYYGAGYRIHNGEGELQGIIASGTMSLKALVIPFALRPAKDVLFSTISNNAFGAGTVYANGDVIPAVGSNTSFVLDGIRWPLS